MIQEVIALNNLENLRSKSIDEVAEFINTDTLALVDKICIEMCPEQDCDPEKVGGCKECIKKWLNKEYK